MFFLLLYTSSPLNLYAGPQLPCPLSYMHTDALVKPKAACVIETVDSDSLLVQLAALM